MGKHPAVGAYHDFRTFHLLLDVGIDDSVNILDYGVDVLAYCKKGVEVAAEHFYCNLRLCARKHGVDSVRYRLTYLHRHSRNFGESGAQVTGYFVAGASSAFKNVWRLDFRSVCPERMFVEFGTSCLSANGYNLGSLEDDSLGLAPDFVALFKRYSRKCGHIDCERAFVERRQESATEGENQYACACEQNSGGAKQHLLVAQCTTEGGGVCFFKPHGKFRFA